MASRDLQDLDPRLIPLASSFIAKCKIAGINAFIDCTYRSNDEQLADYAKGRTAPGDIITYAGPGQSAHNFTTDTGRPCARAFDIAIYDGITGEVLDWNANDAQWQKAIQIGRDLGLQCGADWPKPERDCPHFELKNWRGYDVT